MNIEQFLLTKYCQECGIIYNTNGSYIDIRNSLIIGNDFPLNVDVDKVLNVMGSCVLSQSNIKCIVNVGGYAMSADYNKLIPGSFINNRIHDTKNSYIHLLLVNGYVMHNGVLS